jgi:Response regulator containing a CheY-like receiver domain and an HTH DNA-binding domain
MEPDFVRNVRSILMEDFGFPQVALEIITDNHPLNLNNRALDPKNKYQKATALLKNEQTRIIGLLTIFEEKSTFADHLIEECFEDDCLKFEDEKDKSGKNRSLQTDALYQEIAKIVEKALQIHIGYYQQKENAAILENIISKLPAAIILFDSNMQVVHINQEALKLLEIFGGRISPEEAKVIVSEKFISNYINSGKNEFSLSLNGTKFEVSIQNHILHNVQTHAFTNCYQMSIYCTSKLNESKWNEYLRSRKLTGRECEICNLMRSGNTNEEIASKLFISINTMKRHRESIYKKLNINRVNQLNIIYEDFIKKE